jgi:tungstate transport system substrate-binding protein
MGYRITLLLALVLFGCGDASEDKEQPYITLATTTSARNSGLLEELLPQFTAESGIEVRVVAVGTGRAVQLARDGDADGLLVHHKGLEEQFVADGFGIERLPVMYNEFIIVGPKTDPAGVAKAGGGAEALKKIAQHGSPFVSRGDKSGTHLRELATWEMAGIDPAPASGTWYREAGSGMGATLNTAVGMKAYCLTDSGTWLNYKERGPLVVLVHGDPKLFNPYTFIVVSPEKHPHVKRDLTQTFADWLVGPAGQKAIAAYRINGEQAFFPNAEQ